MNKRGALNFSGLFSGVRNPYDELSKLKVKDLMTKSVITVSQSRNLADAAHMMIGAQVGCLVVTDKGSQVGIITERDFIKKMNMSQESKKELTVEDIMTKKIITAPPSTTLFEAHRIMKKNNFRKLVIAEDGDIKGIITQSDLCKQLVRLKGSIIDAPLVHDVMTKKVFTVSPGDTFEEVKRLMAQKDMGSVVIEDGGAVLGMFTEFDIVSEYYMNPNRLRKSYMKDLMTSPVLCITPEFPLPSANKFMLEKNFRRLPILQNGKIVGIITQTDVARGLYDQIEKTRDKKHQGLWAPRQPKCVVVRKGNLMLCELGKK